MRLDIVHQFERNRTYFQRGFSIEIPVTHEAQAEEDWRSAFELERPVSYFLAVPKVKKGVSCKTGGCWTVVKKGGFGYCQHCYPEWRANNRAIKEYQEQRQIERKKQRTDWLNRLLEEQKQKYPYVRFKNRYRRIVIEWAHSLISKSFKCPCCDHHFPSRFSSLLVLLSYFKHIRKEHPSLYESKRERWSNPTVAYRS